MCLLQDPAPLASADWFNGEHLATAEKTGLSLQGIIKNLVVLLVKSWKECLLTPAPEALDFSCPPPFWGGLVAP